MKNKRISILLIVLIMCSLLIYFCTSCSRETHQSEQSNDIPQDSQSDNEIKEKSDIVENTDSNELDKKDKESKSENDIVEEDDSDNIDNNKEISQDDKLTSDPDGESNNQAEESDIVRDGLILWFDASDKETVVLEEGKVNKWISKVGSYEAIPDIYDWKDSRPGYIEIDGKNMIRFNGEQYLVIEKIDEEGDISIFVVSQRTEEQASDSAWQRILSCLDPNNPDVTTDNVLPNFCVVAANPDKDPGNGEPYELYVQHEERNGVKLSNLGIGVSLEHKNHQFLIGDIAEILIYNRKLNDDEINKVKNYLSDKWGI